MRNDRHFSALVYACFCNKFACFKLMYSHAKSHSTEAHSKFLSQWLGTVDDQKECLFYAVQNQNCDLLTYLIDEVGLTLDSTSVNADGKSLLHIAAAKGNSRMVYELCQAAAEASHIETTTSAGG